MLKLFSHIISVYPYLAVGMIRHLSPNRILNVDLFAQVYNIFHTKYILKLRTVSNFRLNKFLYRGGLTGKF